MKRKVRLFIPFIYSDLKILCLQKISHKFYNRKMLRLSFFIEGVILSRFKCAISCQAKIGENVSLPHPIGIVIGGGVVIENNVTIYQNVTLGRKNVDKYEYPYIGKGSIIYSGASILGNVKIADYSKVGAHSLLTKDTEINSTYAGIPAMRVK